MSNSKKPLGRVLKLGSVGKDVLAEKRAIYTWKYGKPKTRTATRLFGPFFVKEVKQFQKAKHLRQDGKIGPATHNKLKPFIDSYGAKLLRDAQAARRKKKFVMPLNVPMGPGGDFTYVDAEGAPDNSGTRHHAAHDWFAPSGAPIFAPLAGTIVEVRESSGTSGQIFGGTVKIQIPNGNVIVFRHVVPGRVYVGKHVEPGDRIASVSPWSDGPEHTHVEIWKTLSGGYDYENMMDPVPYFLRLQEANR